MAEYVEKRRAAVRVLQPGLEPIDGWVSLAPQSAHHDGPETILELLNSTLRVIPLVVGDDETTKLITRLNIDWLMATDSVPHELICPPTYWVTREERVKVFFNDGRTIDGLIQMELPPDLNRPSDFLNGPEDFFPLVTRMGTLLVNKSRVRETRLFSPSPAPIAPS